MKANDINTSRQQAEIADAGVDGNAPGHLSFRENVILTIKVLAIAGTIIGGLWAINGLVAAK